MKRNILVGDLVKLNCGGPPMVVKEVMDERKVVCQWFDGKKLKEATLPLVAIYLVGEETK